MQQAGQTTTQTARLASTTVHDLMLQATHLPLMQWLCSSSAVARGRPSLWRQQRRSRQQSSQGLQAEILGQPSSARRSASAHAMAGAWAQPAAACLQGPPLAVPHFGWLRQLQQAPASPACACPLAAHLPACHPRGWLQARAAGPAARVVQQQQSPRAALRPTVHHRSPWL